jgi:hypothetical protein
VRYSVERNRNPDPNRPKCVRCGGLVHLGKTRGWCLLCNRLATSAVRVDLREMVELGETTTAALNA